MYVGGSLFTSAGFSLRPRPWPSSHRATGRSRCCSSDSPPGSPGGCSPGVPPPYAAAEHAPAPCSTPPRHLYIALRDKLLKYPGFVFRDTVDVYDLKIYCINQVLICYKYSFSSAY